ncbi:hypothetical protein [Leifsonia virtsii]|uniref:Uncharacterized protein n=1 Tax=Leifsonia virtsii TaxID=3035915 RepID=A0ABT8IUD3_9MICO|nr:hypothetical protein [Leifsonia virtsii]MDN4596418.1 hypothetical protein [Leifsonia virtsii]
MFVEGTLRWQVTEDCPWDLLIALAVRDLAGLSDAVRPSLPALDPAVTPALRSRGARSGRKVARPAPGGAPGDSAGAGDDPLAVQWQAWFEIVADRSRRLTAPLLRPPHFEAFDRALELQDAVIAHYDAAAGWAAARHAEYVEATAATHARRAADIVDVVREREHELRRQAGYFRLDLDVLPLAEKGAWIVGPHTVVVSATLRDDSHAFRAWLRPLVTALV